MMVGAKVCELTDGFLWFVCGNFFAPIMFMKLFLYYKFS